MLSVEESYKILLHQADPDLPGMKTCGGVEGRSGGCCLTIRQAAVEAC